MKKLVLFGLLGVTLVLAPACGDDDDSAPPKDGDAACKELGEVCHDADDGNGLGAECHEVGHTANPTVCLERYDECITYCKGVLGEGGASSHGHGGAGGEAHAEGGAGHDQAGGTGGVHEEDPGTSGAGG
jgi:hypothetical protein